MCAAFAVAVAAGLAASAAHAEVSAVDDAGARVTLAAPATRIVTLAPHATELVFAAGAGAHVVGVVAGSDYPPAARALPQVGDANTVDLERIVAARPDLVVTWPYTTSAQLAALRAHGIAVFTSSPATIAGIADDIERIGVLAGTSAAAAQSASAFRARIAAIAAAAPQRAQPLAVFYEIWDPPIFTIGGHHLITEAITLCGGRNVFAGLEIAAPVVTAEAVIAAKPDVIVAGADDARPPSWLARWNAWPSVPAVAHGRLVTVDANLLHRPGPRFADGVQQLCTVLR
ncbi:MAG: cobalamin-binding protein [Proteobacteria bacterium]|nr:cobalamin-binding protein [Pseudomonadota bacterium]